MTAPEPHVEDQPSANTPGGADVLATGDLLIDAALRDLATVDPSDLEGQIEAAETLQRTLQARLANLGE